MSPTRTQINEDTHHDDVRDPRRIPGYQGLLAHAMIAAAAVDGEVHPDQKFQIARQVMKAGIDSGISAADGPGRHHPHPPRDHQRPRLLRSYLDGP